VIQAAQPPEELRPMPNPACTPIAGFDVHRLPAFADNYLWLLQSGTRALMVDPGDADVIDAALRRYEERLEGMHEAEEALKVPHMGWNQLDIKQKTPVLAGVEDGSNVYFVHSYYVRPDADDVVACTTNYGIEFCSVVRKDNITATQFHPEKSQDVGLLMLKNFAAIKN